MHEFFKLLGYKESEKASFGVIYPNWLPLDECLEEKFQKEGRKFRTNKSGEKEVDLGRWYRTTINPNLLEQPNLWSKNDYPVYIVVNGEGRHNKDIKFGRALFYEHDNLSKEEQLTHWQKLRLPAPTMQVDTGNKSIHNYWVFEEPVEIKRYQKLLIELVDFAGADSACTNLARLMRVPGFKHQKTGQMVELMNVTGQKYSFEELRALVPQKPGKRTRKGKNLLKSRNNFLTCPDTEANDLISLIEQYTDLGPEDSRGERLGLCPFHDDHNPSMSVNAEKGLFHCFVCGAGGNFETFLMAIVENTSKSECKEINEEIQSKIKIDESNEVNQDSGARESKSECKEINEEILKENITDKDRVHKNGTYYENEGKSECKEPNRVIKSKTTDRGLKQSKTNIERHNQHSEARESNSECKEINEEIEPNSNVNASNTCENETDVYNHKDSKSKEPNQSIWDKTKNEGLKQSKTDIERYSQDSRAKRIKSKSKEINEEITSNLKVNASDTRINETNPDNSWDSASKEINEEIKDETVNEGLKQAEIKTQVDSEDTDTITASKGLNRETNENISENSAKKAKTAGGIENKSKSESKEINEEIQSETKLSPMLEDMHKAAEADKYERETDNEDEDFKWSVKSGVFFKKEMDRGKNKLVRIGNYIVRKGESYDENGANRQIIFSFLTDKNHQKFVSLTRTQMNGSGLECLTALTDIGYDTDTEHQRKLLSYLSTRKRNKDDLEVFTTKKTGWTKDGKSFVVPDRTYGDQKYVLEGYGYKSEKPLNIKGTLEAWKTNVCDLARGNDLTTFCLGVVFSTPLSPLIHVETGGFHFFSSTSKGKTTSLKVAISAISDQDWMKTWKMTDNALELVCQNHNNLPLFLDEIGEVEPKKLPGMMYMIGNEEGKMRMTKNMTQRETFNWKLTYLSMGERTVEEIVGVDRIEIKGGQEVRLVTIPACADNSCYGAFDNIHGASNAEAFAKGLDMAVKKNCGVAFDAYMQYVTAVRTPEVEEIWNRRHREIGEALLSFVPSWETADSAIRRVINRFSGVQLGLELALDAGAVSHTQKEIEHAVETMLKRWLGQRGGSGNYEVMNQLVKIEEFFRSQHSSPRFDDLTQAFTIPVNEMAGYKKVMKNDEHDVCETPVRYLLTPAAFRSLCGGCDKKNLIEELIKRHWLIPGKTRPDKDVRVRDNKVAKFFVFREFWIEKTADDTHE